MTNPMDPNDLLMGGGLKSAAFPSIGASITGRITRTPEVRQQTDPKDKSLKTFKSGDPMLQIVMQLQTDERDPQVQDDDGIRMLYVRANMQFAIRDAVRKAGAKGVEVGGTLTVTYVGDGEKTAAAFQAPKLYAASYQPPSATAANDVLMTGGGNGAAVQTTLPVTTQTTATPPVTATEQFAPPAAVSAPPKGIDQAVWDALNATQRASVLAAANNVG